jgi:hypothetical protein
MGKSKQVFHSLDAVHRTYFPNSLLDRLDARIHESIGHPRSRRSLVKFDANPLTGYIEGMHRSMFARSYTHKQLMTLAEKVYSEEGFQVEAISINAEGKIPMRKSSKREHARADMTESNYVTGSFTARRDKEEYWVFASVGRENYHVRITASPMPGIREAIKSVKLDFGRA